MTKSEHRARHKELHKMLDELVADWLWQTGKMPSTSTVLELMDWSHKQTINPDCRSAAMPHPEVEEIDLVVTTPKPRKAQAKARR